MLSAKWAVTRLMRKSINLLKKHNKSEAASKDAASFHLGVVVTLIFSKRCYNALSRSSIRRSTFSDSVAQLVHIRTSVMPGVRCSVVEKM